MKSTPTNKSFPRWVGSRVGMSVVLILAGIALVQAQTASVIKDISMTKQQGRILGRFKDRVLSKLTQEEMKKDLYLIRWLRVTDFNIDLAEEALMKNIQWRKTNKMDGILKEDWSEFMERYPYWIRGEDKEGKPVVYFDVGGMDIRQAVIKGEMEKLHRYIDSAIENAYWTVRALQDAYQNVTQGVLIINVEGYNLVQHGCIECFPLILGAIQSYENHYPGLAEKLIILNVSQNFNALLTAARKVLSKYTNNALHIFGKNRREWAAFLDKHFEWDQLPTDIGGTNEFPGMEDGRIKLNIA